MKYVASCLLVLCSYEELLTTTSFMMGTVAKLNLDLFIFFVSFSGPTVDYPVIKEWFVYPGNLLKEADVVHPVPVHLPCIVPSYVLL